MPNLLNFANILRLNEFREISRPDKDTVFAIFGDLNRGESVRSPEFTKKQGVSFHFVIYGEELAGFR